MDWGSTLGGTAAGAKIGNSIFPGWGGAIGGGLGLLGGLFGGRENDRANKKTDRMLDQIPGNLKQYLLPYINAGMSSMGKIGGEYDKLISDPNAIISGLGAGYRESPGYQWRRDQGLNAITNAQAAGGMAGTPQHQQYAGELAGNLADQDYQNYLSSVLGLYGTGLQGHQGLTELGAGAGGSLATGLANYMLGRAGLDYTRQANQNQANSGILSSLLGIFK